MRGKGLGWDGAGGGGGMVSGGLYFCSRKASIRRLRSSGWSAVIQCLEVVMATEEDPSFLSTALAHQSAWNGWVRCGRNIGQQDTLHTHEHEEGRHITYTCIYIIRRTRRAKLTKQRIKSSFWITAISMHRNTHKMPQSIQTFEKLPMLATLGCSPSPPFTG